MCQKSLLSIIQQMNFFQKLARCLYPLAAFLFLTEEYIAVTYLFILNSNNEKYQILILILAGVLQLFFILLLWSMIQTLITNPGKVFPPIVSNTQRVKRYCIVCHIFKPERCHHCSTCSQCVLNLDHHCPWVNNCVGFRNRKYFILFIFYTSIAVFVSIILMVIRLSPHILELIDDVIVQLQIIQLVITGIFQYAIFSFFLFHIKLILENKTTLETLDQQRRSIDPRRAINLYDLGKSQNWAQVMGDNKWLWPFPIKANPVGDGITWLYRTIGTSADSHPLSSSDSHRSN